jgi:hypothetical protein
MKTFTQQELDSIVAREVSSVRRENRDLRAQLEQAQAGTAPELQKQVETLTAELGEAREQLSQARTGFDLGIKQAREASDSVIKAHRASQASKAIGAALLGARALPSALDHARAEFLRQVEIEQDADDDGTISAATYAGARGTLADTCTAFLKAHAFYELPRLTFGGTGARGVNGGGSPKPKRLEERSPAELAAEGLREGAR